MTQAGEAGTVLSQAWAQERCLGPHSENKGTAVFKPKDNPSNKAHTLICTSECLRQTQPASVLESDHCSEVGKAVLMVCQAREAPPMVVSCHGPPALSILSRCYDAVENVLGLPSRPAVHTRRSGAGGRPCPLGKGAGPCPLVRRRASLRGREGKAFPAQRPRNAAGR